MSTTISRVERGFKIRFRVFTETVGDGVIPKFLRPKLHAYLEKASISTIPYFAYGIAAYLLWVAAIILNIYFLQFSAFANIPLPVLILFSVLFVPVFFVLLLLCAILLYKVYLDTKISMKVRKMEEKLPDYLSMLSLNLKAGQPLERALESSAEKSFEPLSSEMRSVAKRVRLGHDITSALQEFIDRYDSDVIDESFTLIITSWTKGANTPHLVDRIFDNLEVMRYLRQKIIASATAYRIFLATLTFLIAPAMFAIAYHLVSLIRTLTSEFINVSSSALPLTINAIRLNDSHFLWFSSLALIVISLSTAVIVSIAKNGTIKGNYFVLLLYAGASVLAFQGFLWLFGKFFAIFQV